jgi:hypothetical protein
MEIEEFLNSKGFKLLTSNDSNYFGEHFEIFRGNSFDLRLSSSKSFETIDIRSLLPNDEWFDLALVKALIYNEEKLNKVTSMAEYIDFVKNDIEKITELFNSNYLLVKEQLQKLGKKRAQQMFPGKV